MKENNSATRRHLLKIKIIAFILIFVLLLAYFNRVLTYSSYVVESRWMTEIYEEKENSLDAVYIGSSKVYAYWNPNVAWNDYGITVYPYNCASQPLMVAEYLVREARKTQPDAVYIINISTLGDGGVKDYVMHRLFDFMPFSIDKLKFMDYCLDMAELGPLERLEYYFPIIRYHTKSTNLKEGNVSPSSLKDVNGANTLGHYFNRTVDLTDEYKITDERVGISKELDQSIDSLLDYCEAENVKVLFTSAPCAENEEMRGKINTVADKIEARGFDVCNFVKHPEEMNLDLATDYYNSDHTNVHGSIKYTKHLSEYLVDKYHFKNKKNDKDYESWNKGYENYQKYITPYALDIEIDSSYSRDYSLEAPEWFGVSAEEPYNEVYWKKSEEAQGYAIYRKCDNSSWERIADVTDNSYIDKKVEAGHSYTYTVVPYRMSNGVRSYGKFKYNGVTVKF